MSNNFRMVAKTFYGFEEILSRELKELGAGNISQGVRSVSFDGDKGFMYKANLCLRTAIRILKPIANFRARNDRELYQNIYALDWESMFKPSNTLIVTATLKTDHFNHSLYVSQKTKDAIVDKFRHSTGKRPSVDKDSPDISIHIHIQGNQCSVSLDSSGSSLHQRGYRTETNIAPINEVLAAGLLMLSGWKGQSDFLDPMCGSGTILIEAAMIACRIPANINRNFYAFRNWMDYDPELFTKIRESAIARISDFPFEILGYDKAPSAVRKALVNIENANLSEYIKVEKKNFFNSEKAGTRHLHLLFNPPYGQRLTVEYQDFYKQIGDQLKKSYPGSDAWFITSNLEALKFVGLRPSRKIKVYNGKLESRLVKYSIYEGSKKAKYSSQTQD